MQINPYYLRATETKSKKKDVEATEEDPESSRSEWLDEDIIVTDNRYTPYNVSTQLEQSEVMVRFYKQYKKRPLFKKARIYRSFKHLTLPDAIVLIGLIKKKFKGDLSIHLNLDPRSLNSRSLGLDLRVESSRGALITAYRLLYHFQTCRVTIHEKGEEVGDLLYVVRGNRCEEIMGRFYNKPLVLDPVWNPNKKGVLKHEYFRYGPATTTLIYDKNRKHAVFQNTKSSKALKIKHSGLKRDDLRVIMLKSFSIEDTEIDSQLLFHKGVLLPISGSWQVKVR